VERAHCPFRKTILGGSCECRLSRLAHLPTGCSVICQSEEAFARCEELLDKLINVSQFVLQYVEGTDTFTHGKLLKVQHGGLLGLVQLLENADVDKVSDINGLVDRLLETYQTLDDVPYQQILTNIEAYSIKRRRKS